MTESPRALDQATARTLADAAVDGTWSRAALIARFDEVLDPALTRPSYDGGSIEIDPVEIAVRLTDLAPSAPIDGAEQVFRILVDLPRLRRDVDTASRVPSSSWRFSVPHWSTPVAAAAALGVTPDELDWFADRGLWLRTAEPRLRHYRYRRVGGRVLEIPKERLREVHRRLLRAVLDRIPPHPAAHGFVPGRSVHTFATPHSARDTVIRIDLRAFFPSIGRARIRAVFDTVGYPPAVADTLAALCTTATPARELHGAPVEVAARLRAPHLPQGAPTSPALANLVAHGLDRRLAGLARSLRIDYTRYADDLAFSGDSALTDGGAADRVIRAVATIAADEGFTVHRDKTRVMRAHRRQQLAGLVVNREPRAARDEYDLLRATLFNCARFGPTSQNRSGVDDFRRHLEGRIAWVGAGSPDRLARLRALFDRIDWSG